MQRSRPFPSLLLAMTLAAGLLLIWAVTSTIAWSYFAPADPAVYADIAFLSDGMPVISSQSQSSDGEHYTDLQGLPLERDHLDFLTKCDLPAERLRRDSTPWFIASTATWQYCLESFSDRDHSNSYWYLIRDGRPNGSAYFAGFSASSKLPIGYLGKTGFVAQPPPTKDCFPMGIGFRQQLHGSGHASYYIPTIPWGIEAAGFDAATIFLDGDDNRLYAIDLKEPEVVTLLDGLPVHSCEMLGNPKKSQLGKLVARTDQEIILLAGPEQIERRYAIPSELQRKEFTWTEISPGSVVAVVNRRHAEDAEVFLAELLWFDESGKITRREAANLPRTATRLWQVGLAAPAPILHAIIFGLLLPVEALMAGTVKDWPDALRVVARDFWLSMLLTLIASALFAWACFRRQTRFAVSRGQRTLWTLFVLAMGPAGWIGYRFGRTWPTLEKCPHCDRTIPRDGALCPCCHHEMPRPAPIGLELVTA